MKVNVIGRKNAAALIQYHDEANDMLHRVVVPHATLEGEYVSDDEIALAIPVGVAWEDVIRLQTTPTDIQRELRRRGVWTAQDAISRPNDVIAAVSAAYGLDVAAVIRAANTIAKREENSYV
jgi:hypothetical protein